MRTTNSLTLVHAPWSGALSEGAKIGSCEGIPLAINKCWNMTFNFVEISVGEKLAYPTGASDGGLNCKCCAIILQGCSISTRYMSRVWSQQNCNGLHFHKQDPKTID